MLDIPQISRASELNSIGAQLFSQNLIEPARMHFLAALSLEPNHPQALQNLGAVLRQLGHYAASASVARRSVAASDNNNPFARSNLGVAMLSLKHYQEATAILAGVVKDLPTSAPSWHNYGLVLYMTGRHTEALAAFDKSLALQPSNPQARSDRALTLLALQRLQDGLEAYEVRWEILQKSRIWDLGILEWNGEPLEGRSILVHHEQGFGDGLMLSRFLLPLSARGANITVAVPKELLRLFQASFGAIAAVVDIDDEEALGTGTGFDYHTPFLSLMRWIGISRPHNISPTPYLRVDPSEDPIRLPKAEFRVGICWASGNHSPTLAERRRLVPVTQFLPLVEIPGVSVISLQKGPETKEIAQNGMEGMVFDPSARLWDFAATAELITQLDVVISVDSAVAHLAGALGKPVIMLSPYTRCWRWWDKRTGAPWYTKMRIFGQHYDGTWNHATHSASREVRGLAAGWAEK